MRTLRKLAAGRLMIFGFALSSGMAIGFGSQPGPDGSRFVMWLGIAMAVGTLVGMLIENWEDREAARGSRRDADGNGPSDEFEESMRHEPPLEYTRSEKSLRQQRDRMFRIEPPLDAMPLPLPGESPEEQRARQLRIHRELSKTEPPPGTFDKDPPR